MIGALFAKLFFSGNNLGMVFYCIIKWELILLGGIEAVWGICQILGVTFSNHYLYSITGTFYNPGPYSGYLAMVFPVCLNEYLYFKAVKEKKWVDNACFYFSLVVLLLMPLCSSCRNEPFCMDGSDCCRRVDIVYSLFMGG